MKKQEENFPFFAFFSGVLGIKMVFVSISFGISGKAVVLSTMTCWRREMVVAAQGGV
ncbi:hypothetical protein RKD55_003660 [Rossellomorea marisflavi]